MQFSPTNIVVLVLLVGLVLLMFRSSRKRKAQQTTMATKMVPGARVMLSFGMYGTIVSVNDEKVTADVEVAPGTIVTVHRQTLSRGVDDAGDDVATAGALDATDADVAGEPTVVAPVEPVGEPEFGERIDDPTHRPAEQDPERDER